MNWKRLLLTNIPHEGEGAGAGGGAAEAAAAAGAKPWYEGKADAEMIGHWDNKGWKKDDPVAVAIEATKAAREAQRFVGAPPERLIRLPEKADDEKGWSDVYGRLGVPKEAKEYEFSGLKHADGTEVSQALADTIRNAALAARVPKDRAAELAKGVVKHLDDAKAAEAAEFTAKLGEEKATLAKNWGTDPAKLADHKNMLLAKLGAQRLGIAQEAVDALEKQLGYAFVMEAMRKIGAGTSEDTFHESGKEAGGPMTREGAAARKAELMNDTAWSKRFLDGDVAAVREMAAIDTLLTA